MAGSIAACPKSALLIENDKSLLNCFREQLQREGYAVRTASCTEEGLRLFRDFKPFNVVLINYFVPKKNGDHIDCLERQTHWIDLAIAIHAILPSQGMIVVALDFTNADEVGRPPELVHVHVLIQNRDGELRRLLEKVEVSRAIQALSEFDILRLRKFADLLVRGLRRAACGEDGEDLLKEAFLRTWIGTESRQKGRHWNKKVDFVGHLIGTMRSICNSWNRQRSGEKQTDLISEFPRVGADGREYSPLDNIPSTSAPADEVYELKQIVGSFDHDLEARQVLQGRLHGFTPSQIREKYRFDEKRYVAILTRIRKVLGDRAQA